MPTGWVGEVDVSSFDFTDGSQIDLQGRLHQGRMVRQPVGVPGRLPTARCCSTPRRWSGGVQPALDDAASYDTGRFIGDDEGDGTKIPFRWASTRHDADNPQLDSDTDEGTEHRQLPPRRSQPTRSPTGPAVPARAARAGRHHPLAPAVRRPSDRSAACTSAPTTACCTRSTPTRATKSSRTCRRSSSRRSRRRTSRTSRR